MYYNKHYIRVDSENHIIHRFSDAFTVEQGGNEQVLPDDICINERGGRQVELLDETNPDLQDLQGNFLYKWDGKKVVKV